MTACYGVNQRALEETTEPPASREVFVLLVNPYSQNEGIYSISHDNKEQILMFESREDAIRYNELLAEQDFAGLAVEEITQWEVNEFCKAQRYECKLVTQGTRIIPPQENAETDFLPEEDER